MAAVSPSTRTTAPDTPPVSGMVKFRALTTVSSTDRVSAGRVPVNAVSVSSLKPSGAFVSVRRYWRPGCRPVHWRIPSSPLVRHPSVRPSAEQPPFVTDSEYRTSYQVLSSSLHSSRNAAPASGLPVVSTFLTVMEPGRRALTKDTSAVCPWTTETFWGFSLLH